MGSREGGCPVTKYETKTKACKICDKPFEAMTSTTKVCGLTCAITLARELNEKREKKEKRRINKAAREKIKTRTEHLRDAQSVFNKFIRLRDEGNGCISCGIKTGQMHAGHYRTTAACPEFRFDDANCHLQCSQCNNHKSGNIVEYRINLVRKIGEAEMERIEGYAKPHKWDIDEIVALKQKYREKIKTLAISN